jgi:hypothetical protein
VDPFLERKWKTGTIFSVSLPSCPIHLDCWQFDSSWAKNP